MGSSHGGKLADSHELENGGLIGYEIRVEVL